MDNMSLMDGSDCHAWTQLPSIGPAALRPPNRLAKAQMRQLDCLGAFVSRKG